MFDEVTLTFNVEDPSGWKVGHRIRSSVYEDTVVVSSKFVIVKRSRMAGWVHYNVMRYVYEH